MRLEGQPAALNASGVSQKGRTWKHLAAEELGLLCYLTVLCEQTEILPPACVCPSGFCLLAELWESLKEIAKCLNGSGKSRLLLTASSASSTPSSRRWGVAALAARNCRWLLYSGGTELLSALLSHKKGKRGCKGQGVCQRLKSGKRVNCAKTKKKRKEPPSSSCCACGHCMWLQACLEWCLMLEQAFTTDEQDFFGFASVVALIAQGKGVCLWFGSFLLKAVLAPLSVSLPDKLNR